MIGRQDSSQNGNDGTLKQGPKWGEGKFGKAIEFDGADDSVNVSDFYLPENNPSPNPTRLIILIWSDHNKIT